MMLYDLSPTELISSSEQIQQLFPYTYFTAIVLSFSELSGQNGSEAVFQEIFSRYYDVCHTFLLPDRKQIAAICNHEHFSVKSTGLKRELAELGTSPDFYIGISISSNSYKSLHNLYSNAVQRIFYEKSFGKDSDLTGFSLLTYQDCVRIFTEKDPKKAQELLREYIQNSCSVSPEGLPAESIFSSFFHNISLYLESLELTLPEERQPVYSGANDLAWLTDEIFQALSAVKKALQQTSDH